MSAPSNANTSGLEVSLSAVLARAICESEGKEWTALDNTREDVERWFRLGEVTAASAQAAIDAEKARADRLAKALERAKRVLDNTAITNALRMVGAYEILDTALQQETQP